MALSTKPKDMPYETQEAVAWLAQRCAKVSWLAARCFRFGPSTLDADYAEECLAENKPVPKNNIQEMTDAVVALERSLYVFYNHMQGKHPQIAPPGLVERLKEAEIRLTDLAKEDNPMAKDYFKWLRTERQGPEKEEDAAAS